MSLCHTNYIQRKVKRLKWFNDSQNIIELYHRFLTWQMIMKYFFVYDAPHSVGLLWTSDQLVAETST